MTAGSKVAALELRLPGGVEDVLVEDFNPEMYISKLRCVFPLNQLRNALEREVSKLRSILTELVNDHHSDLIELTNGKKDDMMSI